MNAHAFDRRWALATFGRVLAFVLASSIFYSLLRWEASAPGAEDEGVNILAGLVFFALQIVSAFFWGGFDGRRSPYLSALVVRWGSVAVIVTAFVVVYISGTLNDPLDAAELASGFGNTGIANVVTLFLPALFGVLKGLKSQAKQAHNLPPQGQAGQFV
jgi:hypothetical protein